MERWHTSASNATQPPATPWVQESRKGPAYWTWQPHPSAASRRASTTSAGSRRPPPLRSQPCPTARGSDAFWYPGRWQLDMGDNLLTPSASQQKTLKCCPSSCNRYWPCDRKSPDSLRFICDPAGQTDRVSNPVEYSESAEDLRWHSATGIIQWVQPSIHNSNHVMCRAVLTDLTGLFFTL